MEPYVDTQSKLLNKSVTKLVFSEVNVGASPRVKRNSYLNQLEQSGVTLTSPEKGRP